MKYSLPLLLFLSACASIKPPTGGDIDSLPPKVLMSYPDSAQTNVLPDHIELRFDEYIRLKDVTNLLIISPTPTSTPEYTIRKKSLLIKFSEPLDSNITYNIMINGSVIDNNEGNPLSDYQLTFSTGSFIDSHSYKALVIDAFTKTACEECMVVLYKTSEDSLPLIKKPEYLAKTSTTGIAELLFLPVDSFTAFAIADENKNLKLNSEEKISLKRRVYTDTVYMDTFYIFPYFYQSKPKPKLVQRTHPGVLKIAFDAPVKSTNVILSKRHKSSQDSIALEFAFNNTRDTLFSFTPVTENDSAHILLNIDSFRFSFPYNTTTIKGRTKFLSISSKSQRNLTIKCHQLIDSFHLDSMVIKQDSTIIPIKSAEIDGNELILEFNSTDRFEVSFAEGAVTDINGSVNTADSFKIDHGKRESTNLTLKIVLKDSTNHILELISNNSTLEYFYFNSTFIQTFSNLKPGKYRVRIITDLNNNGIWDEGDFLNGIAAEPVYISNEEELRSNWDKELIINYLY